MARFCTGCGSAIADGAGFCTGCGALAAPVPSSSPAAPPAGKSSLVKFLLIAAGVVVVLCGLALASLIAGGYWLKSKVERAAEQRGVNLSDFTSGQKGSLRGTDPCSLLSAGEAAAVLQVSVTRAQRDGQACNYYIQPASSAQKSASLEQAIGKLTEKSSGSAGGLADLERVAKQVTGGLNDGSTPFLIVGYDEDGKAMMAATKLAMGLMGGGQSGAEKLTGVGDDAILGPMASTLAFLKNGVGVHIDLRQVAGGRARGIELAKIIAARL